jgi:transcriptional regulator with XRE-family HTH domain
MGYRIREVRLQRGITQTELSVKSGVSRAIINGLETGRSSVTTTETLLKIARALEVTADELFFDENV